MCVCVCSIFGGHVISDMNWRNSVAMMMSTIQHKPHTVQVVATGALVRIPGPVDEEMWSERVVRWMECWIHLRPHFCSVETGISVRTSNDPQL